MSGIDWTLLAQSDLEDIDAYWWVNNPTRADEILNQIRSAADFLLEHPEAGPRIGVGEARKWTVRGTRYRLIYRASAQGLEILRVRHSASNWLAEA